MGGLVREEDLGDWFPDGMFLANVPADLAGNPDGCFISHASRARGAVRLVEGARGDAVEVEGSPDIVLEVVSNSSVRKDTETLRELYWEAGVREYWRVDARGEEPRFDLLRRGRGGFTTTRQQGGWVKSMVLGRSFRLVRSEDRYGYPAFTLEIA